MSLAIVCCHFNPAGFRAPRRNLMRFIRQMKSVNLPVFVAELAYDSDPFFLPKRPHYFQFRCSRSNVIWHKENLINMAVERVPLAYDKVAWIDPDVMFLNPRWHEEAERALDTYAAVQLFAQAFWTDQEGRCCRRLIAAMASGIGGGHTGFAWAGRRELWTAAGGLCELAILGGGDALFAAACMGAQISEPFFYPLWPSWVSRLAKWISENGGCGLVQGSVVHEWHGDWSDRSYLERLLIIKELDIEAALTRRLDGLLQYTEHAPGQVRDSIASYFSTRKEDGNETLG